jgi:signal transduction protein with GAF and PtsI domain
MQATAAPPLSTTIWQEEASASQWKVIEPVIELAITQANAQGAYVYCFDRENARASLSAFVGPAPFKTDASGAAVAFHQERRTPIVIHRDAAADLRFAVLPEFKSGRFDGVVSVPLIAATEVVGMANFCRTEGTSFKAKELAFLVGLSAPLAALLTASTLREELERTAQQLADHKLLDRAKGLLQESLGWTEEEAYLQIRRLSRQQRIPMREIARQVIDAGRQNWEVFA